MLKRIFRSTAWVYFLVAFPVMYGLIYLGHINGWIAIIAGIIAGLFAESRYIRFSLEESKEES